MNGATTASNPAYFCLEVIIVGWEDFLDGEPPVATSEPCRRAIRAHLKAERGRSTHAVLGLKNGRSDDWLLDGKPLAQPDLPGPQGSSTCKWEDRSRHDRVLLTPGEHRVSVSGVERTFTARAGERCELII